MKTQLKSITESILFGGEDYGIIHNDLHALHNIYSSLTGIGAYDVNNGGDIFTDKGKAISPVKAAHCLLEVMRTSKFLRGINTALQRLIKKNPGKRILILYAGCGPYATLITPLTTIFSPAEIGICLLDINETSLAAVQQLYNALKLNDYVTEYIHADATLYKTETAPDMIISETMLNALAKEPQVAIMMNLVPQLSEKGVFIPESITVTASLLSPALEQESFLVAGMIPERIHLAELYTIGQYQYDTCKPTIVQIPAQPGTFNILSLMTDITVYGEEKLTAYNCSLTIPITQLNALEHAGKKITYRYEISNIPGFRYDFSET